MTRKNTRYEMDKALDALDDIAAEEEISHFAEIYWLPRHFKYNRLFDEEQPREYDLSIIQRIFLTLEYPRSRLVSSLSGIL
jgi:hypothetical protein